MALTSQQVNSGKQRKSLISYHETNEILDKEFSSDDIISEDDEE